MIAWLSAHPELVIASCITAAVMTVAWISRAGQRLPGARAAVLLRRAAVRHAAVTLVVTAGCALIVSAVEGLGATTGPLALLHGLPIFPLVDVVSLRSGTGPGAWTVLPTAMLGMVAARGALSGSWADADVGTAAEAAAPERLEPWVRRLAGALALGLVILVGLTTLYLPVVRAPGDAVVPGLLWGGAVGQVALLLALRAARSPVSRVPPSEDPFGDPRTRFDWERRISQEGIRLERQRYVPPPRIAEVPVSPDQNGDLPLRSGREAEVAGESTAPTWAVLGLRAWAHQNRLVVELVAHARRGSSDVLVLDTGPGSGRTTAVLVAAQAAWSQLRSRTLVLYPSRVSLLRALRNPVCERLRGLGSIGEGLAPGPAGPAPITLADVDALVEAMAHDEARARALTDLGAIVVEDAEELSGLRATNLSLLLRRLQRVLPDERALAFAVTLTATRADRSGVGPFAQRLVGASRIGLSGLADAGPTKDLHGYLLVAGGPHRDARNIDPLPPLLQVRWFTGQLGRPVWLTSRHALTSDQRERPLWAGAATGSEVTSPEDAWASLREIRARDALSLPELLAHGGHATPWADHLGVVQPATEDGAVVRWVVRAWLQSTDRRPELGTFDGDLRELGSRLVCGPPSTRLVAAHLHAALVERPASRSEVRRALVHRAGVHVRADDEAFDAALDELLRTGRVREVTRRTLDDDDRILEQTLLVGRPDDDRRTRTPVETTGERIVELVDAAAHRDEVLLRVSERIAPSVAYPGRIFVIGRLDPATQTIRHLAFEVRPDAWRGTGAVPARIPCQPFEGDAVTVPLRTRRPTFLETLDRARTVAPERGSGFAVQRARVRLETVQHGCLVYGEDARGRRLDGIRTHQDPPLTHTAEVEVAVVRLREALPDARDRAVLEAVLRQALRVLLQIEPELVDVAVGPSPLPTESGGEPPLAVLLIDTLDGAAGTLEAALEGLRVLDWLRFAWLWLDDLLTRGEGLTWHDLQSDLSPDDREDAEPDLAVARDLLAAVLGSEARRIEPLPPTMLPPGARERPEERPAERDGEACAGCGVPIEPGSTYVAWRSMPELRFCTPCTYGGSRCDFCSLPTGPAPHVHPDRRESCARCRDASIRTQADLQALVPEALEQLDALGMRPAHAFEVELVDARGLGHLTGTPFRASPRFDRRSTGLCVSSRPRLAGAPPAEDDRPKVYIEDGHSRQATLGTLVHELVHVWQWEQFPVHEVDLQWVEGLAVWAEVQVHTRLGQRQAALDEGARSDVIYGGGFRRVAMLEAEVGIRAVAQEVLQRSRQ